MRQSTEQELKLYCGFCGHEDSYIKKKFIGKGKHANGSGAIHCKKCSRELNHKNLVK